MAVLNQQLQKIRKTWFASWGGTERPECFTGIKHNLMEEQEKPESISLSQFELLIIRQKSNSKALGNSVARVDKDYVVARGKSEHPKGVVRTLFDST